VGISLFGLGARMVGLPLPSGMSVTDLVMAGFVAALGLTVALFVASAAYVDPIMQGQAKMGALLSGVVGVLAIGIGRAFGFGRAAADGSSDTAGEPTEQATRASMASVPPRSADSRR
jgi:NhaA family Na+:H+ antiporter